MLVIEQMVEVAVDAATAAAQRVLEIYRQGSLQVSRKANDTPVTIADLSSQDIIVGFLQQTGLPIISEEEEAMDFQTRKLWEYCWLVDPLDGTREFITESGEFTINIGLVYRGRPVAGVIHIPCSDTLYAGSAETGVYKRQAGNLQRLKPAESRRRFVDLREKSPLRIAVSRHYSSAATEEFIKQFSNVTNITAGSSLKFMLLLEEEADLYPRLGKTMEWDTAAAHAILNAAGRGIYRQDLSSELSYNKEDLSNPYFMAF